MKFCALLIIGLSGLFTNAANAVEHGSGIYLMGSKGPMAGIVPDTGLYFQNDVYYYRAKAGNNTKLPMGGKIGIGVKVRAIIDVPTLIWATPYKPFGSKLAFAISQPLGKESVETDVAIGTVSGKFKGNIKTAGDPLASAILGWNTGSFHWSTTAMVNIPVGNYKKGSMTNIAFNHWATDLTVAGTWFDPAIGWDISGAAGVTINGYNSATKYKSGRELHLEAAISKYITPQFSFGIMGYHYQQISDDTSKNAALPGGFRGRASALGPTASYTLMAGQRPLSVRLKVLREFNVKNRFKGTAGFLTLSLPL